MTWLSGALAMACLFVGLLHLLRLVALHRNVPVEASHAAMGLGMAAMFSPLGDPVPGPVWATVFVACAAWFGALALRNGTLGGDAAHHVLGSVAMLFMLLSGHSHAPGNGGAGHEGHLGHGAAGEGIGFAPFAAILLAGYFAWHLLRCTDRLLNLPDEADGAASPVAVAGASRTSLVTGVSVPALLAPRTAAVAHLVMTLAMTVMLLGMI